MSAGTRSRQQRAEEPGQAREPEGARAAHHRAAPVHTDPAEVPLETALLALADPVRRTLVRELAAAGDWERPCGSFDVPVTKATLSRHFAVLREAGLLEQRDAGPKRFNRLRRPEFEARFPGLLGLVLREDDAVAGGKR
ncbi:helix-turn-helix domain-containing protein [Streptomyces mobaraensis NBRC 13819 = DSM 40847]|uniref:Regulatory protein ArsR n=1 Tax=Streptomyces mobaraensis (strain ATCC 29032 / DSM 40847 / JCM 4168 / NBRC 13819 / NCIMB 11159 / IPCR 16-22) TaxID=1223523 RepID=M3B328_STRM1|nr:helix-turn-helix domain-containing protein [Streptomyces mobaraensis]EMF00368.1 regulatory protein ArsR [Streptomyces mobaraensis NBRC 13819 = DSM 40847]QTT77372.1 helix-turn-helix domain-containing protein [Streptomyces mobaraensis NBRC 13819 = DSM 40847]